MLTWGIVALGCKENGPTSIAKSFEIKASLTSDVTIEPKIQEGVKYKIQVTDMPDGEYILEYNSDKECQLYVGYAFQELYQVNTPIKLVVKNGFVDVTYIALDGGEHNIDFKLTSKAGFTAEFSVNQTFAYNVLVTFGDFPNTYFSARERVQCPLTTLNRVNKENEFFIKYEVLEGKECSPKLFIKSDDLLHQGFEPGEGGVKSLNRGVKTEEFTLFYSQNANGSVSFKITVWNYFGFMAEKTYNFTTTTDVDPNLIDITLAMNYSDYGEYSVVERLTTEGCLTAHYTFSLTKDGNPYIADRNIHILWRHNANVVFMFRDEKHYSSYGRGVERVTISKGQNSVTHLFFKEENSVPPGSGSRLILLNEPDGRTTYSYVLSPEMRPFQEKFNLKTRQKMQFIYEFNTVGDTRSEDIELSYPTKTYSELQDLYMSEYRP